MPGRGRSRARGGVRGRGRGRGHVRGRGRGRGAYNRQSSVPTADTWGVEEQQEKAEDLDINKDVKGFFVETALFEQHFDAQEQNRNRYAAAVAVLEKNGVEISQSKLL